MTDNTYKIKMETEGIEEATEPIGALANAYDGFPAQVTIRNCHDCTINVYPSQTRFVEEKTSDDT